MNDQRLLELASTLGTPVYVYDMPRLRARVAELRAALEAAQGRLFFATMANDQLPVLRLLADLGVGACVNSIPHLELALHAGFGAESIQFTSTGIRLADMRVLQALQVQTNIDSIAQLQSWFNLGGHKAGVRVNAASLGRRLRADRIGIDARDVSLAVAIAAKRDHEIAGLHIYVGTNFQDPAEMLPTLGAFFELAATVPTLSYVNIGGGIGVNYRHDGGRFDLAALDRGLAELARGLRRRLGRNVDLIMEPGRGLVAECGVFVTAVTDVKALGGNRFAAVDASVSLFPRPLHHPDTPHHVRLLGRNSAAESDLTDLPTLVVGQTTFSRDILGSCALPTHLKVGDLLVLEDAGAYSQSMTSRFLGQRDPHVAFLDASENTVLPRHSSNAKVVV